MRELQPYFDSLLMMPSREIKTFQGHANVFGTTAFVDFRLTSPHVPRIDNLLQQVQDLLGLPAWDAVGRLPTPTSGS